MLSFLSSIIGNLIIFAAIYFLVLIVVKKNITGFYVGALIGMAVLVYSFFSMHGFLAQLGVLALNGIPFVIMTKIFYDIFGSNQGVHVQKRSAVTPPDNPENESTTPKEADKQPEVQPSPEQSDAVQPPQSEAAQSLEDQATVESAAVTTVQSQVDAAMESTANNGVQPLPKVDFTRHFKVVHSNDYQDPTTAAEGKKAFHRLMQNTMIATADTDQLLLDLGSQSDLYPQAEYQQFKTEFDAFCNHRDQQARAQADESPLVKTLAEQFQNAPLTDVTLPMNAETNEQPNRIPLLLVCTKGIFAFAVHEYDAKRIEIRGQFDQQDQPIFETVFNVAKNKYEQMPLQYVYQFHGTDNDSKIDVHQTIGHQTYMHKQAIIYNLLLHNPVGLKAEQLVQLVHSPLLYVNNSKLPDHEFYLGSKIPLGRSNRVVAVAADQVQSWINEWYASDVLTPEQVTAITDSLSQAGHGNADQHYNHYLLAGGPDAYEAFLNDWLKLNEELRNRYLE